VPSLLHLAQVDAPESVRFDGENLHEVLIGNSQESRKAPLFFRRPPDRKNFAKYQQLPDLAVRDDQWKLLCDYDGGRAELYDLNNDPGESNNVADKNPEVTTRLVAAVMAWNQNMPKDAGDPSYKNQ
jgi:uncharacterized sulfatase